MTKPMTMIVFEDDGYKWRWRIKSSNGRTTATSGESFAKKGNAIRAARRVIDTIIASGVDPDVVVLDPEGPF